MKNKIILPAFILMVLAQLYIPVMMIYQKETVLTSGTEYKFKITPVNPYEPFPGQSIQLYFNETSCTVPGAMDWKAGDPVYAALTTDSAGFAKILSLAKEKPVDQETYVQASVNYITTDSITTVSILYPFDHFYIQQPEEPVDEEARNAFARDTTRVTYALVLVKNGDAVVKDVLIDNVSIREIGRKKEENK